ncbi:MAG: hypothetical protein U9M92_01720 [Patescibacteria group bacterium]|nr:hypothetical protein [Patescibacteria group bacterium]
MGYLGRRLDEEQAAIRLAMAGWPAGDIRIALFARLSQPLKDMFYGAAFPLEVVVQGSGPVKDWARRQSIAIV